MTKQVAKESARELMKGAKRTAVVSGIKSAIISLPNWFKEKKVEKMEGKRYEIFLYGKMV